MLITRSLLPEGYPPGVEQKQRSVPQVVNIYLLIGWVSLVCDEFDRLVLIFLVTSKMSAPHGSTDQEGQDQPSNKDKPSIIEHRKNLQ